MKTSLYISGVNHSVNHQETQFDAETKNEAEHFRIKGCFYSFSYSVVIYIWFQLLRSYLYLVSVTP